MYWHSTHFFCKHYHYIVLHITNSNEEQFKAQLLNELYELIPPSRQALQAIGTAESELVQPTASAAPIGVSGGPSASAQSLFPFAVLPATGALPAADENAPALTTPSSSPHAQNVQTATGLPLTIWFTPLQTGRFYRASLLITVSIAI